MSENNSQKQRWIKPMLARNPEENHRPATPLELLFDLCFVVAIAQAAHGLVHAVAHEHFYAGMLSYALVFFSIWWAWMGFTWFASSFDNDDSIYRLKVLVQMVGVLILAAGVPMAMEQGNWKYIVIGYVVMRIGLVAQWLRAAKTNPKYKPAAHRYALGMVTLQIGWIALLGVPPHQWFYGFIPLAMLELAVPAWAESKSKTPWHPEHIAERYGLLTIIVIGESVLAATLAIQAAITGNTPSLELIALIVSAPIILFAMWWLYFLTEPNHDGESSKRSFIWGYIHIFIFMSAAAVGAGISIYVSHVVHESHISRLAAGMSISIPVVIFLASLSMMGSAKCWRLPVSLIACLLAPFCPFSPLIIAAVLVIITAILVHHTHGMKE